MIYGINDRPPFAKMIAFGFQMVLSVFVASVLIANICGVATSGALFGAGLATFAYLMITGYKSPMFISNSGAFVAPVLAALAAGGHYAVAIGGLTTCIVYCIFGFIFSRISADKIYNIFPKSLIGAITVVIGVNLMAFIGTYVQVNGSQSEWGVLIAIFTAAVIAMISHYAKGMAKILPFLIGTLAGYAVSVFLTVTGVCRLVDFSMFHNMKLFSFPDTAITHWNYGMSIREIIPIVVIFIAYTISAMMECLSDHMALSNIIGTDLYKEPGLGKIFIGEGIANLFSSFFGGLCCCSYGEGTACVGFSKVASTVVTATAAIIMMLLAFLNPIQVFIASIPSCVFGGCAIILYSFIAASGIRMLQKVDLDNQKDLLIVSVALSTGISGIVIGGADFAISGTALALILGLAFNFILKEKSTDGGNEEV